MQSSRIKITSPSVLLVICLIVASANLRAQIRSNWFNINPPQSDLDATDPNGASGGRVHNLGATSNMSVVYGASEWGGLWQSFNSGLTWSKVRTFVPSATYDVKVAAATTTAAQGTVYVSSFYDGRVTNPFSGAAFSRNQGSTWQRVPLPPGPCVAPNLTTEPSGWTISIRPSNQQQVFVGTNCGLARTIDGGSTWTYIDPSPLPNGAPQFEPVFAVLAHSTTMVDVITQNGFFFSTDNGTTWTQGAGVPGGIGDLAVSPYENHVLYAAIGGQLLESNDSGRTWPTNIAVPTGGGRVPFVATNRRSTQNTYDLWYGGVGLFRATCTAANPPNPGGGNRAPLNAWSSDFSTPAGAHNDFGDILFNPGLTTDACPLLVCCDGGIYRNTTSSSPNCHTPTWEQPNITPYATWLYGFDGMVGNNGSNQLYFGLQDNGVFGTRSVPTGPFNVFPTWTNDGCCDGVTMAADPGEGLYVQGAYSPGRAFRVFKGPEGIPNATEIPNYASATNIMSFASGRTMVRTGANAFAFTFSDGVYTTPNINANPIAWTYLSNPTGTSVTGGGIKSAIRQGTTNIYYKTGGGKPYNTGQIWRYPGTAAGAAWTQINFPGGTTNFTVYDVDPTNGNRMMACAIDAANNFTTWSTINGGGLWTPMPVLDNLMTAGGVFRPSSQRGPREFYPNFGRVWQPYMFEINPLNTNVAVAGAADAGIFLTTDFGVNWVLLTNPTAPTSVVSSAPHVPRPLFAWFSSTRVANATTAFDVWVGTQGAGVQKFLIETP